MVTTVSKRIYNSYYEAIPNAEAPANNGTRKPIGIRHGFREVLVKPGATQGLRIHTVPAIRQAWWYDASRALGARWVNLIGSSPFHLVNRSTTVVTAIGGMTSTDYLYIGTVGKVGGYYMDVGTANTTDVGGAATAQQAIGKESWVSASVTDGSDTGTGVTFGQDGGMIVTAATHWKAISLNNAVGGTDLPAEPYASENLYWTRIIVGGAIDAGTTLSNVVPMAVSVTGDSPGILAQASTEYTIPILSPWIVGGLEMISNTATATTADLTWLAK